MPWKEISPESEQERFIEQCQAGEVTFVEACRQFGISRKTGYKRLQRFRSCGWDGLGDRSRAPRSHPNETPRAVAEQLIAARRAHPTWGPKKLIARLRAVEPEAWWPAPSTAGNILDRAGLVRRRKVWRCRCSSGLMVYARLGRTSHACARRRLGVSCSPVLVLAEE